MEDKEKNTATSAANRLWLVLSAVMAVTLIAVFMVPDGKEQAQDIPLPDVSSPSPQAAGRQQEDSSLPASEAGTTVQPELAEGQAARQFLAQAADLDAAAIYRRAGEFAEQGLQADAWLLYFKAARQGHAQAAMVLAEQADPEFFDPARSMLDEPDLVQAHKWYVQAQRNGSPLAPARLEKLMERLRKAAASGDHQAELLLAKWKTK